MESILSQVGGTEDQTTLLNGCVGAISPTHAPQEHGNKRHKIGMGVKVSGKVSIGDPLHKGEG